MNCLVIEDEKIAAERLCNLIRNDEPTLHIISVIQSVKNAVGWFQKNSQPDLIFMDIQLSDGLSFEIFEQVEISVPVIFTTAFNEYTLKAFKVNSIDYLLKPIDPGELHNAIGKFKTQKQGTSIPQSVIDQIIHNYTSNYKSKFVIKVGEHIRVFTTENIQCFFSLEKSTFLQNTTGRDYAVPYTLDQLEELLDPGKFFRINRKYIVSFPQISDIINFSNSRLRIKLKTNESDDLIVSREKVQSFKSWLEE